MDQKVSELARKLFANAITTAENLGSCSKEEQIEIFKIASQICFTAAMAFCEVENELKKEVDKETESQ
jgi:hypothetical protein